MHTGKEQITTNAMTAVILSEEKITQPTDYQKAYGQTCSDLFYIKGMPDDDPVSVEDSKNVQQEIENNLDICYFETVDNGKAVSSCYAVYIPNLTRNNRGICFIENLVTDKDHRNQGLASKVIDMAISYSKRKELL